MWAWIQEAMGTGYDGRLLALLVDGGLKGMVLMAVAGLAVLTMRRSTASARHLVYFLALVGLLVLPLGSLFIPKWQLPLLPAVEGPPVDLATPPPASDPSPSDTEVRGPASWPVTAPPMPAPTLSQATPMLSDDTVGTLSGIETPPRPPEARHRGLAYWLLALWLAVAFALLVPLLAGMVVLRRMARQSSDFSSEALPKLTQDLAQSLDLRHPVQLLRAPADTMPMAAGLFRAVVFLPADAENWSDEKRRAVLLHELAHVKRRDCLTHALAHLAVSLHWFNPFAWYALHQLRIEREHACDDLVLAAGEHPTEYAEVLLDVARSLRAGTLTSAAAITMAKKSHLEGRLLAVLDEARKRTQLTRRNALGFVLVGAVLTAALATLHVTRAESTVVVDRLTFSSGVEVTLLGVGVPYDKSPLWTPDGTPLSTVPHGLMDSESVYTTRQIYFRPSVPEDLAEAEHIALQCSDDSGTTIQFHLEAGTNIEQSSTYTVNTKDTTFDAAIGVAAGLWEPLAKTQLENGTQGIRDGVTYDILVGKPFKRDDDYLFTLTHNVTELDKRVVVYDTAGEMHYSPATGKAPGINGTNQGEYSLGEVVPEEVRFVELQVREFEWRTFKNIASRPIDKIPFSPAYETALAADTNGRVQIGGGDFGISKIRRMDGPNALTALQFPVWPNDMLHAARFPELAEGDWDCLLINVADNGSHGNKLMKYFDVVQFRVFDHSTRKLLWDSDWRYSENPKFTSGSLTGQDIPVFVARRDQKWPDTIDLWFRVDLLNNGKNTHQMLSVEPNYSIAGGDTGRVQIDEIRAGTWNHSYSESGGDVTWIEQNIGSEASECSVVLRRTGQWTDGKINVRALDATGNEYWPQSVHFLDFERSALEVVTFPIAADRVHQLKFARLEDQEDFRKTFYFDGVTLPPAPAPPVEIVEETVEETASFPPPTVTLSAHEFQLTGTPVTLRLDNGAEKFDSFTSKITIRCDGEELPWFSTEESGVKMMIGANFSVSPRHPLEGLAAGKHRVSVLLHDVEVRPRSGTDREPTVVYPTIETNEVEFEVLPEIPADYFEPTMEDGWKSMLDNGLSDLRVLDHDGNPVVLFLDWHIDEGFERPFALAFDVAMEEQTSGSTYPMGALSDELRTSFFQPRQHIPLTMDNDDARDLFRNWYGKQVRLVMTPSSDAALEDPAIRSYYGEVYRTEWVVLKPELTWSLERSLTPYGVDGVVRYGNRETHFGVEGVHRYGDTEQTILIEDWGLTCKAIVDGGAVVLDAESETRILSLKDIVLPGAALDYVQQHLKELDESEVREIAVEPGALNYIGVRAPSGEAWILLLDTNCFGEREIYRWQVPLPQSAESQVPQPSETAAGLGEETTDDAAHLQFRWEAPEGEHDKASALPWFEECKPSPEAPDLWVEDYAFVTGDHVASVESQPSNTGDDHVVLLTLTEDGAARFFDMTKAGIGRKLAIVIDNQVVSAPVVQAPIRNAIMIAGNFDKATAEKIAAAIESAHPDWTTPPRQAQPVYKEGWEELLREKLADIYNTRTSTGGFGNIGLELHWEDGLPFDLAFDVSIQHEGSEKNYPLGSFTRRHDDSVLTTRIETNATPNEVPTRSRKQVRLLFSPSQDAAAKAPEIQEYYGRRFTTDWFRLRPSMKTPDDRLAGTGASEPQFFDRRPAHETLRLEPGLQIGPTAEGTLVATRLDPAVHMMPSGPSMRAPGFNPNALHLSDLDSIPLRPQEQIVIAVVDKQNVTWMVTIDTAKHGHYQVRQQRVPDDYARIPPGMEDVPNYLKTHNYPVPEARLTAHAAYPADAPVALEVNVAKENPYTSGYSRLVVRVDDVDYTFSRQGLVELTPEQPSIDPATFDYIDGRPAAPSGKALFSGWHGFKKTIELGPSAPSGSQKPLPPLEPGIHRASVHMLDVTTSPTTGGDDFYRNQDYHPEISTNEVTFEIVETMDDAYLAPKYEEGWDEVLRDALVGVRYDIYDDGRRPLKLDWRSERELTLPFNLAFEVSAQREGAEQIFPLGMLTAVGAPPAKPGPGEFSTFTSGPDVDELVRELAGERVRLLLIPSAKAALRDPAIRIYYGQEFTTPLMRLKPAKSLVNRKPSDGGFSQLGNYGKPNKRLLIEPLGVVCEPVSDGGKIVPAPDSHTRLALILDAHLPFDAEKILHENPDYFRENGATEITIAADGMNYVAVESPSGEAWLLLIDTDREGNRQVYYWQVGLEDGDEAEFGEKTEDSTKEP